MRAPRVGVSPTGISARSRWCGGGAKPSFPSVIFRETGLAGAFIVDLERARDDRGFFARAFCQSEFAARGLQPGVAQANVGHSTRKGTLRGMHFQFPPARRGQAGARHARRRRWTSSWTCARRARPSCSTPAVRLSADDHRALYVPERFAHGYQTLEDDTEVCYQASAFYAPERGGRAVPARPAPGAAVAPAGQRASPPQDAAWQAPGGGGARACGRRMAL